MSQTKIRKEARRVEDVEEVRPSSAKITKNETTVANLDEIDELLDEIDELLEEQDKESFKRKLKSLAFTRPKWQEPKVEPCYSVPDNIAEYMFDNGLAEPCKNC